MAMIDVTDTRPRDEILAEVWERMAGGESVATIFAQRGDAAQSALGLPTARTFYRWLATDENVRAAYRAALAARGHAHAEEIFAVADELANDGNLTPEKVAVARLRCDVRKWNAARMLPKLYGDRTVIAGDADSPLAVELIDAKSELLRGLAPRATGSGTPGESGSTDA